ncbi:DUF805 domain-containing protein [uncultured Thalassospira sp.]|jgi:uncharacterized membrane protein YhaH (DUF805 family)|uniref:DUF805 domain-containing protein n=1 Tax=uncultured Thalassospira sp. TaxID=404382 RepID=UPI0030DD8F93|tara:strand:- start:9407 stop:9799 length:393 start_codon:yes stop_codon:yes gene_type:complete
MKFGEAVSSGFNNFFNFRDRASRSAFWWWQLFVLAVSIVCSAIDGWGMGDQGTLEGIFNLITFVPGLALAVRRLHDTDRSGWWMLLTLVPLIGLIVLIVWWCKPTQLGPNRFGPMPYDYFRRDDDGDAAF